MVWISATPSSASSSRTLRKYVVVVVDADVLEHADRDDAVELAGDLAVVLELEAHGAGRPSLAARSCEILSCSALSVTPVTSQPAVLARYNAEAAPARADVEHALARLDGELGGDVALLGELRLLQVVAVLEVAARILPVAIEEQVVDGAVDVVVVRHVAPRPTGGIELQQPAAQVARGAEAPVQPGMGSFCRLERNSSRKS